MALSRHVMHRTSLLWSLSSLSSIVLLLFACGGQAPSPARPAPAPVASSEADPIPTAAATASQTPAAEPPPAPAPGPAPWTPPTTKLLEAGSAPRRALRYKIKPGAIEWMELDMQIDLTVTANGRAQPQSSMPTQRALWKLEAKDVSADGDVRVALSVESVELLQDRPVPDPKKAPPETEMAAARGVRGTARVSSRGIPSDVAFDGVAETAEPNSVLEMARDFYVPFPAEEIGKGGKWEVLLHQRVMGGVTETRVVYTVTKIDAAGVQADVVATMSAEPHQPLRVPNLPGTKATLDSVSGTFKGTANIPFARLVGNTATRGPTVFAFTTTSPRGPLTLEMASTIGVATRAAKAPAAKKK